MRIRRAARAHAHDAGDLQHEFIAHALRHREHLGGVRIEHDLQQPLAVAQVDENDAAVVAPPMRPTGHRDDLADRRFADLTTIMSAHKLRTVRGKRAMLRLRARVSKPGHSSRAPGARCVSFSAAAPVSSQPPSWPAA